MVTPWVNLDPHCGHGSVQTHGQVVGESNAFSNHFLLPSFNQKKKKKEKEV